VRMPPLDGPSHDSGTIRPVKGRWNPLAGLLLVLLAVLPLLPTLVSILRSPWPESSAEDDLAVLEIRTIDAGRGEHLAGPYSRFGWSHPGPAEFYLLLPPYLLSGRKTAGLGLGAVLLNLAAVAGLAFVAFRILGVRRAAPTVALLAGLVSFLGPAIPGSAWNPHITILPFALFLFLAAAFALKGPGYLPAAVFVASAIVQTHLAYVPVIAAVSAAALWERSRTTSFSAEWPRARRPVVIALVLLAVLWLPPLVEELRNTPGNLTLIARFFLEHGAAHRFGEILGGVVRPLAAVPLQLATLVVPSTSDQRSLGAGFLTLLLVALLPLARASAAQRRDGAARILSTTAVVALGVTFWSVSKIREEILDYLVLWTSAVGFAGWAALAAAALGDDEEGALGRRKPGQVRLAGVVLAVILSGLATASNARRVRSERPIAAKTNDDVRRVTEVLRSWITKNGIRKPLLDIGTHDTWVPAAGVFLNLHKSGIPFAVAEDWWPMFGRTFRPNGTEAPRLVLGDASLDTAYASRPDFELVGRGDRTVVYALQDPRWLERHLRRSPGRVLEAKGTRGEPSVVADGRAPAEGSVWDGPGSLVLEAKDSFVTVAVPAGSVVAVVISADNNDTYAVSVSGDGATFEEIGVLPTVPQIGMRERALFSPKLRGARALRISPRTGDGAWSIGEVSFAFAD
jgi:hypothetical protein